jgi:hypothetical protein
MHVEVFFVGSTTGWCAAIFADGNQVGDGEYAWAKKNALRIANQLAHDDRLPIEVYGRNGEFQKEIK